ncbi:hypothetical protein Sjap_015276 [Stephania japonica]|uniref:Uncharacterized protein n=1 Tax=Stephania japonica TaxID=461633 RepID=A0AAP0IIU0_9MAGN
MLNGMMPFKGENIEKKVANIMKKPPFEGHQRVGVNKSHGGDGPLRPSGLLRGLRRGASGVGLRATAPCPTAVEAEEGWQPPLSSPLHGLYGVGKKEPPSGALTPPFSGEDGTPLWAPTTHSSGSGGGDGEAAALALMMPPPPNQRKEEEKEKKKRKRKKNHQKITSPLVV